MKKINYVIILINIFILFIFLNSCAPSVAVLEDEQYCFSIKNINFGGNWAHYKGIFDNFILIADNDPHISGTAVNISSKLIFNEFNVPFLETFDTNAKYILETKRDSNDKYGISKLKINTIFSKKSTNATIVIGSNSEKFFEDTIIVKNKSYNELNLNYNVDSESVISLDLSGDQINDKMVPDAFNYNVKWEFIHKASNNNGSKTGNINFVVMAEGYRADQIEQYKIYVKDAFENCANFNYLAGRDKKNPHLENIFFKEYWDKINIIMMETISPHEGIDKDYTVDNIQSILNLSKGWTLSGGDFTRIQTIVDKTRPNDMWHFDADAYIILVNDDSIGAYSFAYWFEIGYRNGQPIHPVVIKAPYGNTPDYDPTQGKYHDHIATDAIVHELGHAIGRLQDEYINNEMSDFFALYWPFYRNIDNDTNFKWIGLNNRGYGGGDKTNNKLGSFEGGLYRQSGRYRPTHNGTMNGIQEYISGTDDLNPIDYQYGAVNTYHMTASFKIRMGEIKAADLNCGNDNLGYEWQGYSLDDFKNDWPPSRF